MIKTLYHGFSRAWQGDDSCYQAHDTTKRLAECFGVYHTLTYWTTVQYQSQIFTFYASLNWRL